MRYISTSFVLSGETLANDPNSEDNRRTYIVANHQQIDVRCDLPAVPHTLGYARLVHMYAKDGKPLLCAGATAISGPSPISSRSENDLGQLDLIDVD